MNENTPARYRDKTVRFRSAVIAVRRLGVSFIQVTAAMPRNVELSPGDTIVVEVAAGSGEGGATLRRYTVSAASNGVFEVVAFLTGRGPATPFLEGVSVGDELVGQGPERPVKVGAEGVTVVAVVGDETGIGTARAVALSTGLPIALGLDVSSDVSEALELLGSTDVTLLGDHAATNEWLSAVVDRHGVGNVGLVAVGEQSANNSIRQHALGLGVPKDHVATRTFWRPDRVGLE